MSSPRPLRLGEIVGTRRDLAISEDQRNRHMHVIGATGGGKSFFMESLIRQDVTERRGLCLVDPVGGLADRLLRWISRIPAPPRNFYYIAPHRNDFSVCYNVFRKPTGPRDDWFFINTMRLAVAKVWGADDTKDTPRIDQWLTNVFYTALTLNMTLPEISILLSPRAEYNPLREKVAQALPKDQDVIRDDWMALCKVVEKEKASDFENFVGSTQRRLSKFVRDPRIRRIFGVADMSLDLTAIMDEGAVVIVDLSAGEGQFHSEDAEFFGTLLLTDFFVQMRSRRNPSRPFTLYVDEFQNFVNRDIARMLDMARNYGLRLVLAHQRPGQLQNSDKQSERDIYSAVMSNARTKVLFGGVTPRELEPIIEHMTMGILDIHKIKRVIESPVVRSFVKEYWEAHSTSHSRSHSSGSSWGSSSGTSSDSGTAYSSGRTHEGSGPSLPLFNNTSEAWSQRYGRSESMSDGGMDVEGEGESESTTRFPVLVPQIEEQISSVYYETLDEQLYQWMAIAMDQQTRHAMVQLVGQRSPVPIVAPFVSQVEATPAQIARQLAKTFTIERCFLPVAEAEARVAKRLEEFRRTGTAITVEFTSGFGSPKARRGIIPVKIPMEGTDSTPKSVKVGGVQLQARDLALLTGLFDSRLITVAQAARLFYGGSEDVADRRLRKLYEEAELLDRLPMKSLTGRPPAVYTIKKPGFDLLIERELLPSVYAGHWDGKWRKRFKVASSTVEHECGVVDIKAALLPAINAVQGRRVVEFPTWPEENKFTVTAARRRSPVTVKPDGYLCIHNEPTASHKQYDHFYLEFDRGGEKLETLWNKFSDYRVHYRSGGFLKWLGYSEEKAADYGLRFLFVMTSAERLSNFLEAYAEDLRESSQLWLTTFGEVQLSPLGPIWTTPANYFKAGSIDQTAKLGLLDETASPSTGPERGRVIESIQQQAVTL